MLPDGTPWKFASNRFPNTPWNLVRHFSDIEVLNELYKIYWQPLFFFVRRRGYDHHSSADIVQEFLKGLFERSAFKQADPERGRFRTWLLAALDNFLKDWNKSATRAKRGGGVMPLSLDFERGESEYVLQVPVDASPEEALNRAWARSLLESAINGMEAAPSHVLALRMRLNGENFAQIAAATGLTPAAARTATHRLRPVLRAILEARIRATVTNAEEFKAELNDFFVQISVTRRASHRK